MDSYSFSKATTEGLGCFVVLIIVATFAITLSLEHVVFALFIHVRWH